MDAPSPSPGVSQSRAPTSPAMMTGVGMILGTAAYMSPEQAKGRKADERSDIWAFGCVLYEMLTGRAAFRGEDVTEILSRVLQNEPDWTLLPASLAPSIPKLLRLCLRKDAKKRRQTAADVWIDIEEALVEPVVAAPHARGIRVAWIVAASAVLVAVALAIPAVRYLSEARPSIPPEMRLEITTPPTTSRVSLAISPDGQKIVLSATDGASGS